jgi:hypothetical protein
MVPVTIVDAAVTFRFDPSAWWLRSRFRPAFKLAGRGVF